MKFVVDCEFMALSLPNRLPGGLVFEGTRPYSFNPESQDGGHGISGGMDMRHGQKDLCSIATLNKPLVTHLNPMSLWGAYHAA